MTTPQIRIIDGLSVIDRNMTEAEIAIQQAQDDELQQVAKTKAEIAKTKAEVIAKLGLTDDEVAALLS
jgi:hypothetical protein